MDRDEGGAEAAERHRQVSEQALAREGHAPMMPGVPVARLTNPLCDTGAAQPDGFGKPQAHPGANSITVADL